MKFGNNVYTFKINQKPEVYMYGLNIFTLKIVTNWKKN